MSCFPKPDSYCRNKIKVQLDLLDYTTKSEIKKQQVLIHLNLLKMLKFNTIYAIGATK